jgi:hypothetical protein
MTCACIIVFKSDVRVVDVSVRMCETSETVRTVHRRFFKARIPPNSVLETTITMNTYIAKAILHFWRRVYTSSETTELAEYISIVLDRSGLTLPSRNNIQILYTALYYIFKLSKSTHKLALQLSDKAVFATSLVIADGIHNDNALPMASWSICTDISARSLVLMRRSFLAAIDYDVNIKRHEYYNWIEKLHVVMVPVSDIYDFLPELPAYGLTLSSRYPSFLWQLYTYKS